MKTNNLSKKQFIITSKIKNKIYKEYFIPYQIEKNNLISILHERIIHKRQNSLYELIKQENFGGVVYMET